MSIVGKMVALERQVKPVAIDSDALELLTAEARSALTARREAERWDHSLSDAQRARVAAHDDALERAILQAEEALGVRSPVAPAA